jgi:NADH-quinone oxidoreductase subunit J
MVLFLFVIMLLDLKREQRRKIRVFITGLGVLAVAAIAWILITTLQQARPALVQSPEIQPSQVAGTTELLGRALFGSYVLPFEVISLLLLVAMIGTVLLSKKELK